MDHTPYLTDVLIIIPAFNEAGAIYQVVQDVKKAVSYADVLVINDGSADNTAEEAKKAGAFVISHPFNLCIGGTFQTGLKFACQRSYHYVVRIDGDGQHKPSDIGIVIKALKQGDADAIICSRFLSATVKMDISRPRQIGIRFFAWLVSVITKSEATDTTSGFIGLNQQGMKLLSKYIAQDYPEVESRIILHNAGLKTVEMATEMHNRVTGKSSINAWRSFYYAVKVSITVIMATIKKVAV